jgi:hypothetical protein
MAMHRRLLALAIALTASAASAERGDALGSLECRQALEALQAREAALPAAPETRAQGGVRQGPAPDARWLALRRAAARACLGGRDEAPMRAQRATVAPIVVPPVVVATPAPPRARPTMPPPKAVEPVTVITACDAVGCWASDGSRLLRIGPNLQGPRGLCSVQGGVLHCP